MRLYMVRHGQTEWNAEKRLQGQADAPLSALGRKQAESLNRAFANHRAPDVVVASDLPRARETAAIIGYPDATLDQRFREINVGSWTARLISDIRKESDDDYRGWRAGSFTPEGGESWSDFKTRIVAGINEVVDRTSDGVALVVAHGGVIRATCEALLGLKAANVVPVGPATMTIFEITPSRDGFAAKLEGYNVSPHGAGLNAPD